MTFFFKTIDAWWITHPHVMDLILFCTALFASVFPDRSRRWLIAPMQYSVLGVLRLFQRDAKRQLEILRLVDGSSFKLVAYIGYYCIHSLFWSLGTSAAFYVCVNAFSYWQTGHPSILPFNVLFLGTLLGKATKLYIFLGNLLHPEGEMINQLETMAAGERLK